MRHLCFASNEYLSCSMTRYWPFGEKKGEKYGFKNAIGVAFGYQV